MNLLMFYRISIHYGQSHQFLFSLSIFDQSKIYRFQGVRDQNSPWACMNVCSSISETPKFPIGTGLVGHRIAKNFQSIASSISESSSNSFFTLYQIPIGTSWTRRYFFVRFVFSYTLVIWYSYSRLDYSSKSKLKIMLSNY